MNALYVCLSNKGNPESLECRKIYQSLPDEKGEALDMIRIIDESGEDYLYPKKNFAQVDLPDYVQRLFTWQIRKAIRESMV